MLNKFLALFGLAATADAIFHPAEAKPTKVSPTTGTSTAEISIGPNVIFKYVADQDTHIFYGKTGMAAADNTCDYVPSKSTLVIEMPNRFTHIRVFNPSASTANVFVTPLSKA